MSNLKIGEKIKAKRRERDLTQEELATILGVSKAAVSKWENEESLPDITMLPQLAQLFHITMDELFDYTLAYKQNRNHLSKQRLLYKARTVALLYN